MTLLFIVFLLTWLAFGCVGTIGFNLYLAKRYDQSFREVSEVSPESWWIVLTGPLGLLAAISVVFDDILDHWRSR